jgi:hypothetical protein
MRPAAVYEDEEEAAAAMAEAGPPALAPSMLSDAHCWPLLAEVGQLFGDALTPYLAWELEGEDSYV